MSIGVKQTKVQFGIKLLSFLQFPCCTYIQAMVVRHAVTITLAEVEIHFIVQSVFPARIGYGIAGIKNPVGRQGPFLIELVYTHYGDIMCSILARIVPLIIVNAFYAALSFRDCIADPAVKPAGFLFK